MQDSKFGGVASCGLEHGFEFHYARADHVPLAHRVPGGWQEAIDEVGDEDVCEQFPGRDVPVAAVLSLDVEYADLGCLGIESVDLGYDYISYLRRVDRRPRGVDRHGPVALDQSPGNHCDRAG